MNEKTVIEKRNQLTEAQEELNNLHYEASTVARGLESATSQANASALVQLTARHNELPFLIKAAQIKVSTANIELLKAQKAVADSALQEVENKRAEQSDKLRVEIEETQIRLNELIRQRETLTSDVQAARFTTERIENQITNAKHGLDALIREQTNRQKPKETEPEYVYFGKSIERGEISSFDN